MRLGAKRKDLYFSLCKGPAVYLIFLLAFPLTTFLPVAVGQDTVGPFQEAEQRAREELEEQEALELSQTLTGDLSIKYGGWTRFSALAIEDESTISSLNPNDRYRRDVDTRWWGNLNYRGEHRLYFRGQFKVIENSPGDQFIDPEDREEWNIDQFHYTMDIQETTNRWFDFEIPFELKMTAGRQSFFLGSGLVYNRTHDGVKFKGGTNEVSFEVFGSRSKFTELNVDSSIPDFEISRRHFYGGQVHYQGFAEVVPYLFGMIQRDDTPERPNDPDRDYEYDSEYLGAGFTAEPIKNLSVEVEGTYQSGKSHSAGTAPNQTEEDIDAYSYLLSGTYYWNTTGQPETTLEYIEGSGDPDRGTVTDTVGGNTQGTDDENFLYFGFRPVGLSLNPRISNIRILKLGGAMKPFKKPGQEFRVPYRNVKVGIDLFRYWKIEESGAISDVRATEVDKDIGWEWDAYVNWTVFSDTTFQLRYGRFHPGDAYLTQDVRDFISAHLTVSY